VAGTTEKANLMSKLCQQMLTNLETPPTPSNVQRSKAENLAAHLNAEELAYLRTMVAERAPTSPSSLDTDVESTLWDRLDRLEVLDEAPKVVLCSLELDSRWRSLGPC